MNRFNCFIEGSISDQKQSGKESALDFELLQFEAGPFIISLKSVAILIGRFERIHA